MEPSWKTLPLLILMAIPIYGAAFWQGSVVPESRLTLDSVEYLRAARNTFEQGIYYGGDLSRPIEEIHYSRRPPLYPVLIGILALAFPPIEATIILQMILSLTGAYLLWRILAMLHVASWLRVIACALYLLYPTQVIYSQMIMAELLLQFLLLLSFYCLCLYLQTGRLRNLLSLNLCLGLSLLAKPVMLFFWIPSLLFHLYLSLKGRLDRRWILLSLIPLLFILLWSYRNYRITGSLHYTSMLGSHLMLLDSDVRRAGNEEEELSSRDLAVISTFLEEMLSTLPETVWRFTRGVTFFFLDPGRFDLYEFLNWPHEVRTGQLVRAPEEARALLSRFPLPALLFLLSMFAFNGIVAALFLVYIFLPAKLPEAKFYLLLLLFYSAAVVGMIGRSRYRLAVEPLLIIAAVVVVERSLAFWAKRQRARGR